MKKVLTGLLVLGGLVGFVSSGVADHKAVGGPAYIFSYCEKKADLDKLWDSALNPLNTDAYIQTMLYDTESTCFDLSLVGLPPLDARFGRYLGDRVITDGKKSLDVEVWMFIRADNTEVFSWTDAEEKPDA